MIYENGKSGACASTIEGLVRIMNLLLFIDVFINVVSLQPLVCIGLGSVFFFFLHISPMCALFEFGSFLSSPSSNGMQTGN